LIALCLLLALAFVTAEEAETFEVDETEEFEEAAQAEEVEEEEEVEDVQITKSPKKTGKKTGKAPSKSGKKTGKAPSKSGKKTGKAPSKSGKKTGVKTAVKPSMMMSHMATTLKPCYKKPYNGTFKKLNPPLGVSVNVTYRHFTKVQWRMPLDAPKNATFLVRYWNFEGPVFARGMKQKIKTKPGETFIRINKLLRPGLYRLRIRTIAKCFTKSDWANLQFNVTTRRQQIQLARVSQAQAILPSQLPSRSRV